MKKLTATRILILSLSGCFLSTSAIAADNSKTTRISAPLFDGLGNHHHPVTTTSKLAQRYFDQGLSLCYGFNHKEAIRSFQGALKHDADCAMAHWGIAYASGPHVNKPMSKEDNDRAWEALEKAVALKPKTSAIEQSYIDAVAKRYQQEFQEDRSALDKAYAAAMRSLVQEYPGRLKIFHIDVYRLPSLNDPLLLAIEEMIGSDSIVIIEWADRIRSALPHDALWIEISPVGESARLFSFHADGPLSLQNLNALRWHMSRFTGYAGVVNYQGSKFLAIPKALRPVFVEVKDRGLFFLEDGSMALSSTESAASITKAKVQRAKVVIDADPSPEAIISALTLLEEQATGTGLAIGTGSGLEVTIDTVREWAKAAAERGIVLVPISASFKGRTG
jgi:tetratricopeptide (TPR) repeat protein